MPYVVRPGREVYDSQKPYKCGAFVPGSKGSLADLEEDGAVEWVDAPTREPRKVPAARRKAVKP